jgi:MFS family permease
MEKGTTSEIVPATQTGKKRLLVNRNFALLVVGQGISQFGDFVFTFTLMVWIAAKVAIGQPWGPLAISAMMVSAYIPYFVIGPWAGVFVDRWSHRRTMVTMDAIRAILIGLLILGTGSLPLLWHLPPLFLIIIVCVEGFLDSTCGQFFNPASRGLIGQIVPEDDLARASGLSQSINATAKIIGPLLAPPLYFAVGIFWGLLVEMLSFVVSLLTLRAIRVPQTEEPVQQRRSQEQPNFWREFTIGLSFVARDRVIRTLIISLMILTLGASTLDPLLLFFIQNNLHTALSLSGVLVTAVGLGTIIGGILFGNIGKWIGLKRLLWLALLSMGLCLIVFSRATNFWFATIVLFPVGALMAGLSVAAGTLMISETPKELIGRVSSASNSLSMLSGTVSIVLGGYLASAVLVSLNWHILGTTFRAVDTVFIGTGVLVFLAGFYALIALRGTDGTNLASTNSGEQEQAELALES